MKRNNSEIEKNYVFYDLETNGLDYYTTGIMQISMIDVNGNVLLNQYVYPFDNRIDCSAIHGIDEQKLINNNAISTIELCELIKRVLREKYERDNIYLVAYNNFGYDQIILENNFKITGIKMPGNWFFVDLYPIIKEVYPDLKPNFKLATVFKSLCKENDDDIQYHCALADTTCLYKIYNVLRMQNYDFLRYTRSLLHSDLINDSPIMTLNGYHIAMKLEDKNIKTIGDLYYLFQKVEYKDANFEDCLRTAYNIYSKYGISNMIKHMKIIKHLRGD
jgi:DNA polymerase III epsilon subunit-like protein